MSYKEIDSKRKLALYIGVPVKQLTWLLYVRKIENCYNNSFSIKKKNGDDRIINAPNKSLKYVQRRLARLLLKRLNEVYVEGNIINNISHGFFKGKSIKTNAVPHRNKKYILNIDLKDFFDSIHFGRVQGFFKNNNHFKLPEVATIIAQLTCYEGKLPQGAPTSPVISNLICQILDYKILSLCKKYRLTYTRYADDLTFSTNDNNFKDNYSNFLSELDKVVVRSGFEINSNKIRFQEFNYRQTVTGLTVNKKVNVRQDYYKRTRSMAHSLYTTEKYEINGRNGTINQLEGRFSFINDLVKYNNRLVEQNSLRLNSIEYKKNLLYTQDSEFVNRTNKNPWKTNLNSLSIREKDYQKFLFYKYFIANPQITFIPEGKTDEKYIKAALKRYYKDYPNLVKKVGKKFVYNITFIDRSKRWKYFFGVLEGGGSDLYQLLNYFTNAENRTCRNYLSHFKSIIPNPPKKPVIFLLDNEFDKKKPLNQFIKKLLIANGLDSNKIESTVHEEYLYNIDLNAFIMTIPFDNIKNEDDKEIEDLLDIETINNELISNEFDGKIFDKNKQHDDPKYIGKEIFANTILKNHNSKLIDFTQFKPLLDLINQLSTNYSQFQNK
ncbi:retron Ec67 family RNA-directed DNA polymerase/endonuclease [Streptococcus agalactiae]|uniref:retron Ec67 family RNA-directed DNA polymerase/endonuclease n=1 Tax=Streptococcus agalactiae TaxID=1311 RepID=UPI0002BBA716|nr:retron Ec67 family RNA-directed DNA polymerase/endonuclease [Streptococcus agalactiae]EPT37232.1 hypothetical protein SAG0024_01030 [Streptococcus agalactiae FSL C1-494]EPT43345.1 hypothetical protein SAG0034_01450 [Streptococcus agalactiae FSL S3-170]EPV86516.1 hypothetical protein SAG0007_10155 [Streptococcus agalactiae FSL C1-487]HEO7897054.1 retron Ec67 family RNA-directed DNA polymerase/endonuclease [Streptococcus agalactiae]